MICAWQLSIKQIYDEAGDDDLYTELDLLLFFLKVFQLQNTNYFVKM